MEREPLVDTCRFRPRFEKRVYHRWTRQIEYMVFCRLVSSFRHLLQGFGGKRQINRFFGLLHGYSQTVLSSINKHVFPLQADNIAYPQSAEAGEQISLFYGLVFHRSSNQCPNLFYGHIRPLTLRQTDRKSVV